MGLILFHNAGASSYQQQVAAPSMLVAGTDALLKGTLLLTIPLSWFLVTPILSHSKAMVKPWIVHGLKPWLCPTCALSCAYPAAIIAR